MTFPFEGTVPLKNVAQLTECPGSPELKRPVMTFTWSRNFSKGFRMGENSNPTPSFAGVQSFMIEPCGTYTKPKRCVGAAAVLANGVCAGTIDSKKGNAIVTPAPCKNVLRDRCFF